MTIHNPCALYAIRVIRAVMWEQLVPPLPPEITLQELYSFAKLHNVESLLWHGLCGLELDFSDPVLLDWENRANMLLAQGIVQLAERDVLFGALTGAGIALLPVKGCWLKELYPNMEYRQMVDLDMLIPEEKAQEAKQILLSLGYHTDAFDDAPNHAGYLKPPYMEVELHTGLIQRDNGYYDDIWSRVEQVEGYPCLYRMKAEDEYIFYLRHLNRHFEDGGSGIRSILDSVVYRNAYPDMDMAYLDKELKALKLWEMAQQVQTLADCWFKTGAPVPGELTAQAQSILTAGSYGTIENVSRNRLEKLEGKYKNPIIRGVVYWVDRICRPRQEMARSYPILKKLPVLLPVFWVIRAAQKFGKHPKAIWNHVKIVFGKGKQNG